jgi:hypothetical protein
MTPEALEAFVCKPQPSDIVATEAAGAGAEMRRELAELSMKELCVRAKAAGATEYGSCHAQCQPVRFAMTVVARCLEQTYGIS